MMHTLRKLFKSVPPDFKTKTITAIQEEWKSAKYPLETNIWLNIAIQAITAAEDDNKVFEIAVGIYNWVSAGATGPYGFTFKDKDSQARFLEKFNSVAEPKEDEIKPYIAQLGTLGVILEPSEFLVNAGYPCYSPTPLPRLHKVIKEHQVMLEQALESSENQKTLRDGALSFSA